MSLDCETMISFLLLSLQISVAIAMPFPYRGSNSEEAQPYGPYNHLNLQMPHVGAMYGFGLPHYSQMIQMQQALSRQPVPWLPHIPKNKETAPSQMPQSQIKQQFQQHPSHPLPQPKPNYQHVPNQPLQLPPAPDSQTPQMFPPFPNPLNPFWPQGNYFGYFGFGGRPPYNSEEANEDEEAPKEKDPPKAEPPVTESSNTSTVDNNSTIVDHGQGNNTAQNESLVAEIPQTPNVIMGGPNKSPPGEHMIPSIHGRHGSIIPGPPRPFHHIIRIPNRDNLQKNIQQRYYTVNRVLGGRGNHPNSNYPSNLLINKAASISHPPTDERVNNGETQPNQGVSGRPASPLANVVRGIFHDTKPSISRTEHIQKHNGYNTGVHGDFPKLVDHSQAGEHPNMQINRNIVQDHNIIYLQPQHNEHISEYSRNPIVDERKSNIPSGIFLNHHSEQYQPKQSETSQKSNNYDIKSAYVNYNNDIPSRNEDHYAPSGTFDSGGTWSNRYISVSAGNSGQPPEMIYLMSSLPSDTDAVHAFSNQRQNQWDHPSDQKESPQYVTGQRGANIYTEDELNVKTSTNPQSENQPWQTNDFAMTQTENMKPQPYRQLGPSRSHQIPLAEPGKKEMYITTDNRHPNSQKHFSFISKAGLPKTQERVQFSGNEPSYQFRGPGSQKLANTLDHTSYYTDYEANPHALGKNTQTIGSRTFDGVENVQFVNGDDMPLRQNSPVHLKILTIPETQPWGYNPQEIPFEQRQYNNYDSYPSNMKVQLPYQRETVREHGGQRHYMCTLPFVGDDPGRGITNSLLYLCCKLAQVDQGSPSGTAGNIPEFRLTLKEYNEFVPQQDRTHRQHTRNVGDPPKTGNNQPSNSFLPNCNASNTPENTLISRSDPGGTPCITKACDGQNLDHPYESFDNFATVPCGTRGDNYLPPKQDSMNSQKKNFLGREKTEIPLTNVQDDGSRHVENNMRMNKGTGKLLQVLTCPKDRQMHEADTPASLDNRNKIDAFTLKDEFFNGEPGINKQDGSPVLHMAESDPANNAPDCLILNK